MNDGGPVTSWFAAMRVLKKQDPKKDGPKLHKRGERLQLTTNKRLADQTRKILAKHYANKYRVR